MVQTFIFALLLATLLNGDQQVCIDHLRKILLKKELTNDDISKPIKLAATDTCSQKSLSDVMSNFVDNLQSNLPVSKQGKFLSIIKALDSCLKSKNSSLQKLKDHVNKYILDVYGPSYTKIKKCGSIATSQGKKCSDSSVLNCIYDKFKNTTTSYQYEDLLKRINYKKGEYTCLKGNMTEILKFPSSIN